MIEDSNNVIIKECIERYDRKKWRWSGSKEKEAKKTKQDIYSNPPPTKKRVIDLTDYDIDDNN